MAVFLLCFLTVPVMLSIPGLVLAVWLRARDMEGEAYLAALLLIGSLWLQAMSIGCTIALFLVMQEAGNDFALYCLFGVPAAWLMELAGYVVIGVGIVRQFLHPDVSEHP